MRSTTHRRGNTSKCGYPVAAVPRSAPNRQWPRPRPPIDQRSQHRPRSPAIWETDPTVSPTPAWRRPDPGYWRHEPPRPAVIPWCPLRCAACVRRPFYLRHSRAAPFFSGLHRLAVYDGRAGRGLSARRFPHPGPQGRLHSFPGPVIPPFAGVPPDRAPGWQVMGHQPPGYATAQHVENPVDHLPRSVVLGWPLVVSGGSRGANSSHWASVKSLG